MTTNTDSENSFNIEALQQELKPLLSNIFDYCPELKVVLEKYGILEFTEIQLNLDIKELEIQEVEVRNSRISQFKLNIDQFTAQQVKAACYRYCMICGDIRPCGTCPRDPNQC